MADEAKKKEDQKKQPVYTSQSFEQIKKTIKTLCVLCSLGKESARAVNASLVTLKADDIAILNHPQLAWVKKILLQKAQHQPLINLLNRLPAIENMREFSGGQLEEVINIHPSLSEPSLSLIYAAQQGDTAGTKRLLSNLTAEQINFALPPTKTTALYQAVMCGKNKILKILVTNPRVDLTKRTTDGLSALDAAIDKGNEPMVQLLLKSGRPVDMDVPASDGFTPLQRATQKGHSKMMKALLEAKAGPDRPVGDNAGYRPLHIAAEYGNVAAARVLLDAKANPDVRDDEQRAPLHIAAEQKSSPMIKLLLDGKASADAQARDDVAPLHIATQLDFEMAKLLLRSKARPDIQDKNGETPLLWAAQQQDIPAIRGLLEAKANPNIQEFEQSLAPIDWAVEHNDPRTVKLLLRGRADPNKVDRTGMTPLHVSAGDGQRAIVQVLSQHNARLDQPNPQGAIPLHFAAQAEHTDIVRLLLSSDRLTPEIANMPCYKQNLGISYTPPPTVLHAAVVLKKIKTLAVLVEFPHKINLNAVFEGLTALQYAIQKNQLDAVRLLANQPSVDLNPNGWDIVSFANLMNPNPEIIQALKIAIASRQMAAAQEKPPTAEVAAPSPDERKAPLPADSKASPVVSLPAAAQKESVMSCIKEWEKYLQGLEAQHVREKLESRSRKGSWPSHGGMEPRGDQPNRRASWPDPTRKKQYAASAFFDAKEQKAEKRKLPSGLTEEIIARLEEQNYYLINPEKMPKDSGLCFVYVTPEAVEKAEREGVWKEIRRVLINKGSGGLNFVSNPKDPSGSTHEGFKKIKNIFEIVCKGEGAVGDLRLCGSIKTSKKSLWENGPEVTIYTADNLLKHDAIKKGRYPGPLVSAEGAPMKPTKIG